MMSNAYRKLSPISILLLLLVLSACAPTMQGEVSVLQQPDSVTFYPRQAGIERTYLPQGAPLTAPALVINELGATSRGGQLLYATREYGKGVNKTVYRSYTGEGVFKVREEYPSHTVTYDPPLREYPAWTDLTLGARWSGEAVATFTFPSENLEERVDVAYEYTVVDKRKVSVNGNAVEVYVINLEATDAAAPGAVVNQEFWFAPHVGLVRTTDDLYLVNTNLSLPRSN